MKTSIKILLTSICFLGINYGCKKLNGDFDLQSLHHPFPSGTLAGYPKAQNTEAVKALDHPFYYLSKGTQAFVFSSEDGEYVLKVFRPLYPTPRLFGCKFHPALFPGVKSFCNFFLKKQITEALHEDCLSYVNAIHLFKEESLVEYLHLEKTTNLQKKIKFFDKIGIAHEIDADGSCFLIQKKTDLLQTTLKNLVKENRFMEAQEILKNLLFLLKKRTDLNFYKPSDKFRANFGCIGLTPIQIDIGKLTVEPEGIPPKSLNHSLYKLNEWLEKEIPELLPIVEELRISLAFPEPVLAL